LERSITVAEDHAEAMKRRSDQIQFAISIEVGDRRATFKAWDSLYGLKGSVAVRELDSARANNIRSPIAVQVSEDAAKSSGR